MRHTALLSLAAAVSLAGGLSSPAFSAEQQGRSTGGGAARGDMQRDRLNDQDRLRDRDRLPDRDTIYGSQLMTPAERNTYRNKMRNLRTVQEREALRTQHHQEMQQRAQERGLRLPDSPPAQGARGGMGPGPAMQQRMREQTEQETRERSTGDQSGGN